MQWNKTPCTYLKTQFRQAQTVEETAEVRLQEDMPDIGRVICAWGQPVLRSKQWRSDSVVVTGGVSGWVLYAPEDGSQPQCVETWIPFQAKWNLSDSSREGTLSTACTVKNMDARMLSDRKLMVRAAVGILAEALEPEQVSVVFPEDAEAELLEKTYPVTVRKEAGEKAFLMEEQIAVPAGAKLLAWELEPAVTEQTVLGNRLVAKGNGRMHLIYQLPDGKLSSMWETLPFAQYADLEGEYDKEATAECVMAVSSLEPEMSDGQVTVKCGLVCQYVILDRTMLKVAEDAYCPNRAVKLQMEEITLPVILDHRNQNCAMEGTLEADFASVMDVRLFPEQPVQYREGDSILLEMPVTYQVAGYDGEGNLQSKWQTCVEKLQLPAAANCWLCPNMTVSGEPTAAMSGGKVHLSCPVTLEMVTMTNQPIPMLTDIQLGQEVKCDESRPSVILRRADDLGLWQMAKSCNSTMEAIRQANGLTAEPVPGQMLLVPVC